jgi:hypothetical protein
MARGGKRPGAGRPRKPDPFRQIIGCREMPSDMLPHEVLAAIARGEPMKVQYFDNATGAPVGEPIDVYPTLDQRIRAARLAAPYHAAKMASIQTFVPHSALGGSPEALDGFSKL